MPEHRPLSLHSLPVLFSTIYLLRKGITCLAKPPHKTLREENYFLYIKITSSNCFIHSKQLTIKGSLSESEPFRENHTNLPKKDRCSFHSTATTSPALSSSINYSKRQTARCQSCCLYTIMQMLELHFEPNRHPSIRMNKKEFSRERKQTKPKNMVTLRSDNVGIELLPWLGPDPKRIPCGIMFELCFSFSEALHHIHSRSASPSPSTTIHS